MKAEILTRQTTCMFFIESFLSAKLKEEADK